MKTHAMHMRLATLGLLLALTGCGGGSDKAPEPEPAPATPAPAPESAPSPPITTDRIEPFDPGALGKQAALTVPIQPPQPGAHQATTITLAPLAPAPAPAPLAARRMASSPAGADDAARPIVQIGRGRAITQTATPEATAALLQWHVDATGTQRAQLDFIAPGTEGMRLGVLVQALPAGARLRVYGADQNFSISAAQLREAAERNRSGGASRHIAQTWWSPALSGTRATLVIELPTQASPASVRLAVPLLSQLSEPTEPPTLLAKANNACSTDVVCSPEYLEQGRSVARLRFVEPSGDAFQCSGTLMNDTTSSGTPWLLSAHHRISDQATASTLITDWLLRASSCGASSIDTRHRQRSGGATLLYTSAGTDASFLRLNDDVPAGVVFAGSYFGSANLIGNRISSVHQPLGKAQKLSLGKVLGYTTCGTYACTASDLAGGTSFSVRWSDGIVQQGSSGAGAFIVLGQRRYLVGHLYGGSSSCSNPNSPDYFGRFDVDYRNALHRWLAP